MNTAKELYDRWLAQPELDTAVAEELHGIAGDDAAITDRFYRDLEFGTGGLRGVLGAGTNRMNLYTVRKATQGLADYLNATDLPKKIAIAHDSRNNGELFTCEAARVLAEAFPGREIVPVDCRALVKQHGSLHCATMQYPAGCFPNE